MSPEPSQHSIGDLARLAGVTPRTIRYYVAQGLLPTPSGVGPGAHYGPAHLGRLDLIKRLKRQHLPLAEIRSQLEGLTDDEVIELNRGAPEPQVPTSALEYVRSVLGPQVPTSQVVAPAAAPPPPAGAGRRAMLARPMEALPRPLAPSLREAAPPAWTEPQSEPRASHVAEASLERSQWERLSLGPNLELHVRRPLSRLEQRRVERLITIARQVLKEESP